MDETKEFKVVEPFTDNDGVVHEEGSLLNLTSKQAEALQKKVEPAVPGEATQNDNVQPISKPAAEENHTPEVQVSKTGTLKGKATKARAVAEQKTPPLKQWAGNHKV